jgi:hypothetical protein
MLQHRVLILNVIKLKNYNYNFFNSNRMIRNNYKEKFDKSNLWLTQKQNLDTKTLSVYLKKTSNYRTLIYENNVLNLLHKYNYIIKKESTKQKKNLATK